MSEHISARVNEYVSRSLDLLKAGELDEAKSLIERAVAFNYPQQDLYFARGLYRYSILDLDGAQINLQKELELFPDNEPARLFLEKVETKKSEVINGFLNDSCAPAAYKDPTRQKVKTIAILGNCQGEELAEIISMLVPNCHVFSEVIRADRDFSINYDDYDHIFIPKYGDEYGKFSYENCKNVSNIEFIPFLVFDGFHPDAAYFYEENNEAIKSPIGDYSSIIVYCSFKLGLSPEECASLFKPDFFKLVGYVDEFSAKLQVFKDHINDHNLDGDYLVNKWLSESPFMYTINHPKQFVTADLALELCRKAGLEVRRNVPLHEFRPDRIAIGPIFPVYPGIAETINSGEIYFKKSVSLLGTDHSSSIVLSLEEFISKSFEIFSKRGKQPIKTSPSTDKRLEKVTQSIKEYGRRRETKYFKHPYKGLPNYNYWGRSISKVEMSKVDPVAKFPTLISPETKVATAGSCFAQHVARALSNSGLNYYVSETGPEDEGYGLFSARFGNIYTARQLVQLFEMAYEMFKPVESYWIDKEGKYIDPARPNIGYKFESVDELEADKEKHYTAVREMFENLDVFVFTLGLTEGWMNVEDGSVYPVAPGVISKNIDQGQYQFKNFSYDEVCADLTKFFSYLRSVNESANIILTVSPVPLIATYEDRHVLSSTSLSKSVLRAAADTMNNTFSFVNYFPSYEIITGNFNKGEYFAEDLRGVLDKGVNHVMGLVIEHCTTLGSNLNAMIVERSTTGESTAALELAKKRQEEITEVICDEDLLIDSLLL